MFFLGSFCDFSQNMIRFSTFCFKFLLPEIQCPGEHGCEAWDLLVTVHHVIIRVVAHKIQSNLAGHHRQDGEKIAILGLCIEDLAQCLNEPSTIGSVSPGVEI